MDVPQAVIAACLLIGKAGMTPAELANLATGRLRKKLAQLELALHGSLGDDHRFMLDQLLRSLEQEEDRITATADRITAQLEPYREEHRLLTTTPGVDWAVAATMIAEHGIDMTRFGTAALGRLVQRRSR